MIILKIESSFKNLNNVHLTLGKGLSGCEAASGRRVSCIGTSVDWTNG